MTTYIVIGSKPYHYIDLNDILDAFEKNMRCNMALPGNNNGTKYCDQIMNCHVYENFVLGNGNVDKYNYVKPEYLANFVETFQVSLYANIFGQMMNKGWYNEVLGRIGSNVSFNKLPRVGYNAIFHKLTDGSGDRIFVHGFTIKHSEPQTNYYNTDSQVSSVHDPNNEIDVLVWLHNNNYIDATLCMLEDTNLPCLDCSTIKPRPAVVKLLLDRYGICILTDYFSPTEVDMFNNEVNRVFEEQSDKIEILDKEDCSNDERIFYAEKYSQFIKDTFADDHLFNMIAGTFGRPPAKKTLINKLTFEEGKVKNSGAGWHRDNHHCQFKAIMYINDVNERNGNFQWISNSSMKHIGKPAPRTQNYDTRFTDSTVNSLLEGYPDCRLYNVVGKGGTVILANTTYIHRGNIIEEGERRAVTQYFF